MGNYTIYITDTFKKVFASLDKSEQQWIESIKNKLEEEITGKVLYFEWFREKKYLNKRLYFLIDKPSKKILFISFASKRDQQEIINEIKKNMHKLMTYLRSL